MAATHEPAAELPVHGGRRQHALTNTSTTRRHPRAVAGDEVTESPVPRRRRTPRPRASRPPRARRHHHLREGIGSHLARRSARAVPLGGGCPGPYTPAAESTVAPRAHRELGDVAISEEIARSDRVFVRASRRPECADSAPRRVGASERVARGMDARGAGGERSSARAGEARGSPLGSDAHGARSGEGWGWTAPRRGTSSKHEPRIDRPVRQNGQNSSSKRRRLKSTNPRGTGFAW